ncbi:hypothetical protein PHSY_000265 [Pseudozyma hubeiensis SY62]|uniref:Uncharacterized protein n=1 Tax=Pseudozyma hubeiensis (strain SY62) TaxID=1305764 RepID=R9P3M9_PSEHS|nr:hypothetical protein PHSY_000265 [Pseudozyma hubeiensis SY62]GAC92710.1 hypothetical protein PHSY_000265 [Pseudozyma hubeiensis SY62]
MSSKQLTVKARSRTERALDVLYLVYFGIHLAASIAVDAQLTYPPYSQRVFPESLRKVLRDYMTQSSDPFLAAAERASKDHVWFRVLLGRITPGMFADEPPESPLARQPHPQRFNASAASYSDRTEASSRRLKLVACYSKCQSSPAVFQLLHLQERLTCISFPSIVNRCRNYVPFCIIPTLLTFDMMLRIVRLLPPPPATVKSGKED